MPNAKGKAKGEKKPKERAVIDTIAGAEKPKTREEIEAVVDKMAREGEALVKATGVEQLSSYQAYCYELVKGAFEGVCNLDDESQATVMKEVGKRCRAMAEGLFQLDIKTGMDLAEFVGQLERSQFENLKLQLIDDSTVLWESSIEGSCPCPLLHEGLIKPSRTLCMCTVYWIKYMFEKAVGKPIEVQLVQSVNTGARSCIFRINIKPPIYTSEVGEKAFQ